MPTNQTPELMSSLYRDLLRGVSSWEVWKEINNQQRQNPCGHSEFFEPVQVALLDSVLLAMSRVLDDDSKTMSIPNLIKTESALRNSQLERDIDALLLNYTPTTTKIAQRRNQFIAHSQRKNNPNPNNQFYAEDIDKFITSIVDVFRALGGFLLCADYDFQHVRESRKRETTNVMVALQKDWENHSPANRRARASTG